MTVLITQPEIREGGLQVGQRMGNCIKKKWDDYTERFPQCPKF